MDVLDKMLSIQLSLLKRKTEINKKTNKADYLKKKTVKFTFPVDFPRTEEMFKALVEDMHKDLMNNAPDDIDSIAMFLEYDHIIVDNAISLQTLDDIKMYSKDDVNPINEFFKMTLKNASYVGPKSN